MAGEISDQRSELSNTVLEQMRSVVEHADKLSDLLEKSKTIAPVRQGFRRMT
jgi:hypothetical protein